MSYSSIGKKQRGSYTVIEVEGAEIYNLVGKDGEPLKHPWNGMHLRKYYQ